MISEGASEQLTLPNEIRCSSMQMLIEYQAKNFALSCRSSVFFIILINFVQCVNLLAHKFYYSEIFLWSMKKGRRNVSSSWLTSLFGLYCGFDHNRIRMRGRRCYFIFECNSRCSVPTEHALPLSVSCRFSLITDMDRKVPLIFSLAMSFFQQEWACSCHAIAETQWVTPLFLCLRDF